MVQRVGTKWELDKTSGIYKLVNASANSCVNNNYPVLNPGSEVGFDYFNQLSILTTAMGIGIPG